MRLRGFYTFLLLIILTCSTQIASAVEPLIFGAPRGFVYEAAEPVSCESIVTELRGDPAWRAQAAQEIKNMGDIAIPGGVISGRIHNQKAAEDCWAQAVTLYMESWFKEKTGQAIQLSPEQLMISMVYQSFQKNLGKILKLVERMDAETPAQRKQTLKLLEQFYGPKGSEINSNNKFPKKFPSNLRRLLFQPDDGSDDKTAVALIAKFGIAPDSAVKGTIKSDGKETGLENNMYVIWGKLIDAVRASKNPKALLKKYSQLDADGFNENLFDVLRKGLDRDVAKKAFLGMDDTFTYRGQKFTAKSFFNKYFLENNFDISQAMVPVIGKAVNLKDSVNAMAVAMLRTDIPTPLGFTIFGDKVDGQGNDTQIYAEYTGLFTTEACPGGECKDPDGGHEVAAINFLYKSKSGRVYRRDQLEDGIMSGDVEVTGFIVQNSWSRYGGLDRNGQRTANGTGGYYIITVDYLLQGLKKAGGTIDFVLPRQVFISFPGLKKYAAIKTE